MAGYHNDFNPWGKKSQANSTSLQTNPFLSDGEDNDREDPEMEVSVMGDYPLSVGGDTPIPTPHRNGMYKPLAPIEENMQMEDSQSTAPSRKEHDWAGAAKPTPEEKPPVEQTYEFKIQSFQAGQMNSRDICQFLDKRLEKLISRSIAQVYDDNSTADSSSGVSKNQRQAASQSQRSLLMQKLPALLYDALNEKVGEITRTRREFLPAWWNDDKDTGKESTPFEFAEGENNTGCWGVMVGQKFDFCWHPPINSCRLYITTRECYIYLFWM